MSFMKKNIYVVGAVIIKNGKILCAQRSENTSLPNLWEFPGGKIEDGETPEEALRREIVEELDCNITVKDKVEHTVYEYDFGTVHLTTYLCYLLNDAPVLLEHQAIKWLNPKELHTLEWAPADIPAINKLSNMDL